MFDNSIQDKEFLKWWVSFYGQPDKHIDQNKYFEYKQIAYRGWKAAKRIYGEKR